MLINCFDVRGVMNKNSEVPKIYKVTKLQTLI